MRFKVFFIVLLLSNIVFGQEEITWSGHFDSKTSTAKITAKMSEGWHVYSMIVDEMAGPVSTKFELEKNRNVEVIGKVVEPKPLESYDENFASKLQYFEKTVTFEQELKIKKSTELKYIVTYMICNDVMCYPPVDEIVSIKVEK